MFLWHENIWHAHISATETLCAVFSVVVAPPGGHKRVAQDPGEGSRPTPLSQVRIIIKLRSCSVIHDATRFDWQRNWKTLAADQTDPEEDLKTKIKAHNHDHNTSSHSDSPAKNWYSCGETWFSNFGYHTTLCLLIQTVAWNMRRCLCCLFKEAFRSFGEETLISPVFVQFYTCWFFVLLPQFQLRASAFVWTFLFLFFWGISYFYIWTVSFIKGAVCSFVWRNVNEKWNKQTK